MAAPQGKLQWIIVVAVIAIGVWSSGYASYGFINEEVLARLIGYVAGPFLLASIFLLWRPNTRRYIPIAALAILLLAARGQCSITR